MQFIYQFSTMQIKFITEMSKTIIKLSNYKNYIKLI